MSVPKHQDHKDSGEAWLGPIPSHWTTRRTRRLCEIKKRIVGELGFDVLSITQTGIKVKDTQSNDGQVSMDYSKYQLVEPGDFAMNHMDLLTGFVDISQRHGVTSPDYRVFSLRDEDVSNARYVLYLFQNGYINRIFYAFGQGSSQFGRWRMPTDQFNDLNLPLPPLQEQVSIADFLDRETTKIDALVEEQRRLIALLKEKRQAVISQAVTRGLDPNVPMKDSGVEWLGKVPAHWDVQRVKAASTFLTSGPRGWSDHVGNDGALFVQSGDLTEALGIDFDNAKRVVVADDAEAKRTQLKVGDVLVCITGAKTGKVAVCEQIDEPAFINQHICLIRPAAGLRPTYLGAYLHSAAGQRYFELAQYGLKQGLSLENVKQAAVPVPPRTEQDHIVDHVNRLATELDNLTAAAEMSIALLHERRAALISAAVTGKIDVRGLVPQPEAVAA